MANTLMIVEAQRLDTDWAVEPKDLNCFKVETTAFKKQVPKTQAETQEHFVIGLTTESLKKFVQEAIFKNY